MRLVEGDKVLVQRYSDKGVEYEKTITTMSYSESSSEFALRVAQYIPPGSVLRLTQGRAQVTYRTGRLGGLPTVTHLKNWSPKSPLDPRERSSAREYKVSVHEPGYATERGTKIPGPSRHVGVITVEPHSGSAVLEAALESLGIYAPRGADRVKWSTHGRTARIDTGTDSVLLRS
jgi:hypothetical protein